MKGLYRRKGSPYWWYAFTMHGERFQGSTKETTKEGAQAYLEELKTDIRKNGPKARTKALPLAEYYNKEYLPHIQRKKSWSRDHEAFRIHLLPILGKYPLDKITTKIIEREYLPKREKGTLELPRNRGKQKYEISFATINRELAYLSALYNNAIKWGDAKENPVTPIKRYEERPRERVITKKELEALLKTCSEQLATVIMFAMYSGCRVGEIPTLTWERVDLENGRATIHWSYTKTRETRTLILHPAIQARLIQLKERNGQKGAVFLNTLGKPYTTEGIKASFKRAVKRARIPDLVFHDLRHSYCTMLAAGGVSNPKVLQETMGHKRFETTMRYLHAIEDQLKEAAHSIDLNRLPV